MFSKEWIESCMDSIDSYETPADIKNEKIFKPISNDKTLISDELTTKDHILDIKKMLKKMKERRGE